MKFYKVYKQVWDTDTLRFIGFKDTKILITAEDEVMAMKIAKLGTRNPAIEEVKSSTAT